MRTRLGLCSVIAFAVVLTATAALAQFQQPVRPPATQLQAAPAQPQYAGPQPQSRAASPGALVPRDPRLRRRTPAAPFTLNP